MQIPSGQDSDAYSSDAHRFECTITPEDWGIAVMAVARVGYETHRFDGIDGLAESVSRVEEGLVRGLLSMVFGRKRVKQTEVAFEKASTGLIERTGVREAVQSIEKGKLDVPVGAVVLTLNASGAAAAWQGRHRHLAWPQAGGLARVQIDGKDAMLISARPLRSPRDLGSALLVPLDQADDPGRVIADVLQWRETGRA